MISKNWEQKHLFEITYTGLDRQRLNIIDAFL